jgi:hypothetical protein
VCGFVDCGLSNLKGNIRVCVSTARGQGGSADTLKNKIYFTTICIYIYTYKHIYIERERETERDRERQRETERDRERQRETERDKGSSRISWRT